MRINALLRYSSVLLIILLIGFLFFPPQLLRCLFIGRSADFRLLTGNSTTYVGRVATIRQTNQFRRNIRVADSRIRRFWGEKRGMATLIYCPTQARYEQYCDGGEGAGCSLSMPWGDTYLILGPDGNNADVIAHELCHNELFTRLGWWRVKRQIPQWFNEGLALLLDYRFSNPAIWDRPDSRAGQSHFPDDDSALLFPQRPMLKLSNLETTRDFFGGDYAHTMLAYQTAADEVGRWLTIVGRAGVPTLTEGVANGRDFAAIYTQLEREKIGR